MQTYDVDVIPLLLTTARDLFENYHVKKFILSATLRNEATFQAFLTACGKLGCFGGKAQGLTRGQIHLDSMLNVCRSSLHRLINRLASSMLLISQFEHT